MNGSVLFSDMTAIVDIIPQCPVLLAYARKKKCGAAGHEAV
jgi:hypothetical protein